eukprot:6480432-Amphidinium_carterae.3
MAFSGSLCLVRNSEICLGVEVALRIAATAHPVTSESNMDASSYSVYMRMNAVSFAHSGADPEHELREHLFRDLGRSVRVVEALHHVRAWRDSAARSM